MKTISLISLITLLLLSISIASAQQSEDEVIEGELEAPQQLEAAADVDADDQSLEQEDAGEESLDADIEALKKEVLSLNRDLFILEEDLLFPSNTQFSVFLSMNAGVLFSLDSVQLKIDDSNIANHLYTERELAALKRGGVQRLYIGNLAAGKHEIVAIFTGIGPKGRDYRRGQSIVLEKTSEPQFVEFTIADDIGKEQPRFDAHFWE